MKGPHLRTALELGAAAVAAAALHAFSPLAEDDPFRSTLAVIPLVVAALRALERPLGDGSRRSGALEGGLLAALLFLVFGRRSLGLAATDWFVAAGFLLLLAKRVARLLTRLRRTLGRRTPQRPPAAFFLLPLVVYLAIQPWSAEHRQADGDEPWNLLLAHSLAYDFDTDLTNNYAQKDSAAFLDRALEPQPGDPRGEDGEVYSRHNLLLPLLLAPAYRLAGRPGAMVVMAVFAAALAWTALRLAGRYGAPPGPALLAYAVLAFSPPLLIYSYQIWIEVPAALLVVVALDRVYALRQVASPRLAPVLLGLVVPLVLLPILKLRLALVAIPLAILALLRLRLPRRFSLVLLSSLAAALVGLMIHNQVVYGNLLKIHRWEELYLPSSGLADFARGLFGMFYDTAFGLFPTAPIYLLVLPAGWLLLRRRAPLLADAALVAGPYLLVTAPRLEWYGGWSPPFRYPLVVLPLVAIALVPLFEERRRPTLRALTAALLAVTLVLTLVWVIVPGWTYDHADGRTHVLEKVGTRLGADVARLFPSTIRPRLASFLWPLGSLLLIPLALWPTRRRGGRDAAAWGLTAVFLAAAVVPFAASRIPTRTVEVEDAWVQKERGRPFPGPWVVERPRYTSGWIVPPRGWIQVPVVAGGESLRLRVRAHAIQGQVAVLRIASGSKRLESVRFPTDWKEVELGPFPWTAGEPLVLTVAPARGRSDASRIAVDRLELEWP